MVQSQPVCYFKVRRQPVEAAPSLPTTFSCNINAALEAGTPAIGQGFFQPFDDWEFPALLPTPKKSAMAARPYMPYCGWCTECEHNAVCVGKRQESGLCQSCFDKNVARAAAAKVKARAGSTQVTGDPANLLRNSRFGNGRSAQSGGGRGGRGFSPLPAGGR